MLHKDMDLARLMMHTQYIEVDKLRGRERIKGSKRARSEQHEFSQPRFHGGNRPQFQMRSSIPAPSSVSAPVPRSRQEQGGRSFMSRSQNSVSNRPRYPPCAKCGRDHPGECFVDLRGCFGCGK